MQEVLYLVEQMFTNAKTQEVESAMNDVINIITQEGLQKEKEQIIDFADGCVQHISREDIEKHYNKTYNNDEINTTIL